MIGGVCLVLGVGFSDSDIALMFLSSLGWVWSAIAFMIGVLFTIHTVIRLLRDRLHVIFGLIPLIGGVLLMFKTTSQIGVVLFLIPLITAMIHDAESPPVFPR